LDENLTIVRYEDVQDKIAYIYWIDTKWNGSVGYFDGGGNPLAGEFMNDTRTKEPYWYWYRAYRYGPNNEHIYVPAYIKPQYEGKYRIRSMINIFDGIQSPFYALQQLVETYEQILDDYYSINETQCGKLLPE